MTQLNNKMKQERNVNSDFSATRLSVTSDERPVLAARGRGIVRGDGALERIQARLRQGDITRGNGDLKCRVREKNATITNMVFL